MQTFDKLREALATRAPILQALVLLVIRLWLANIFLKSGLLKLQSWDSTLLLFAEDYNLPFLAPPISAVLATIVEIGAGFFILLGILTPLAALALLLVTLVIEIFVFPGTNDHYHWMLLFGVLIAFGGGKISLDALVFKKRAQ